MTETHDHTAEKLPEVQFFGQFNDLFESKGNITSEMASSRIELDSAVKKIASELSSPAEGSGCTCIDGRNCLHMADGSDAKVLAKIAGGNGLMVWTASELAQTGFIRGVNGDTVSAKLVSLFDSMRADHEEEVFGHTSTNATENNNECGAAMKLIEALQHLGRFKDDYSKALEQLLGNDFDEQMFDEITDNVLNFRNYLVEQQYTGVDLSEAISHTQGDDHLEVLESDPDMPTHNHKEQAVILDFRPGITIDRDRVVAELGIQVFSIDVDAIAERTKRYSTDDQEQQSMMISAIAMQLATYNVLCDGTHPIYIVN